MEKRKEKESTTLVKKRRTRSKRRGIGKSRKFVERKPGEREVGGEGNRKAGSKWRGRRKSEKLVEMEREERKTENQVEVKWEEQEDVGNKMR